MGARTLEARLTVRLWLLAGAIIVLVGAASIVATRRTLDASDSTVAHARAMEALDDLDSELAEGDSLAKAGEEIAAEAQRQGIRVRIWKDGRALGDPSLERVTTGCVVLDADTSRPFRACGVSTPRGDAVAAIGIAVHREAVATLARGMVTVVCVALALVWLAIRRAIRQPLGELEAVVAWTGSILTREEAIAPPTAATSEVAHLAGAFDALVRRLLEALARERASSAHIAHELRTPLTTIGVELEAIRVDGPASRAALDRARGDLARFADVIDSILVLSAPRAAATATRAAPLVNVADLARDLAPPTAVVEAPDEALIEGDEHLLRLVFRNLIDNARKYAGGARAVRVARVEGALRVSVEDQGAGVPAAQRERMFDRYWRGVADGEGRGLGLSLVRAVAERHGGSVAAHGGANGLGLRVEVDLGRLVEWREAP